MTTKSTGASRIDAIAVGDVVIDVFAGPTVNAKFAYVDSRTGERMGSNHRNTGWSPKTIEALMVFIASLERDVCEAVFEEGATTVGGELLVEPQDDGIPSL
jgi:hypothetical protein